jgi:hypothetical protein
MSGEAGEWKPLLGIRRTLDRISGKEEEGRMKREQANTLDASSFPRST